MGEPEQKARIIESALQLATETLRECEEKFQVLFNNEIYAICVFDIETLKLLEVNDTYSRMYGYSRAELISGMTIHDITAEHQQSDEATDQARREGAMFIPLRYHRKKDGTIFPVELVGGPYQWKGRNVMVAMAHDITQRRQTEEALQSARNELEQQVAEQTEELRQMNEELQEEINERKQAEDALRAASYYTRTLIETSLDPLFTISLNGKITDVNAATEKVTGIARGRLIGSDFADYFTDPEKARAGYQQAFGQGQVTDYPLAIRHTSGSISEVLYNASVYRNDQGMVEGVFAAARDITQRKRAEDALRESQALFKTFFMGAPMGIALVDSQSWYVYEVNPMFGNITGRDMANAVMSDWVNITHPDDIQEDKDNMARLIAGEIDGFQMVKRFIDPTGAAIWVNMTVASIKLEGSNQLRHVCMIEDISQRKLADDRLHGVLADLKRSNEELEQFAYIASHDLQEPLRMVASYTQLLADRYEGQLDDRAKKYIGYAVDGAVRMQRLINDLLTYSRVGTRANLIQDTDSNLSLNEAVRNLDNQVKENNAIITHDELPVVRADPIQLGQIFQNLISNAIKFRGEDIPRIHISAQCKANETIFSVRDNGIGIDPQYADRIFVIFQRLHTRAEYPGTGIGLAVCKRIIERHAGRIWFESEIGRGSTFFFALPK